MANFDVRTVTIGDYAPEGAFTDVPSHRNRVRMPYIVGNADWAECDVLGCTETAIYIHNDGQWCALHEDSSDRIRAGVKSAPKPHPKVQWAEFEREREGNTSKWRRIR